MRAYLSFGGIRRTAGRQIAKISKRVAKKSVVAAVGRITSTSVDLKDRTKLGSVGLKGDPRRVLDASMLAQAHLDGIPLDGRAVPSELPRHHQSRLGSPESRRPKSVSRAPQVEQYDSGVSN